MQGLMMKRMAMGMTVGLKVEISRLIALCQHVEELKKQKKNENTNRINTVLDNWRMSEKRDSAIAKELQEVENRHYSEVVDSLKPLAEELEGDRLAGRRVGERP